MTATETETRRFSLRWWFSNRDGKLVLAQFPNPPMLVWLACIAIGWTNWVENQSLLTTLGRGALLAWAADEVLRGSSPFRRILGAVVSTYVLLATFI